MVKIMACLVARLVPSHYLSQCWNVVNWTHRNKIQWNFDGNWYISIQYIPFENVAWKMLAILSRPQCVKVSVGNKCLYHQLSSWCVICLCVLVYAFVLEISMESNWSSVRIIFTEIFSSRYEMIFYQHISLLTSFDFKVPKINIQA